MNFYDERIELAKGRASRNAIMISTVLTLLFGGIRLGNIATHTEGGRWLCLVLPECLIFAVGTGCLIGGIVCRLKYASDERGQGMLLRYYNIAGMFSVKFILFAYAAMFSLLLCLGRPHNFAYDAIDAMLFDLLFVIGLYMILRFKECDVYFNYSLMESEHYWKGVWRHIGRMSWYFTAAFGLSVVTLILSASAFEISKAKFETCFRDVIQLYIAYFLRAMLIYLLASYLERSNYGRRRAISRASIVMLFLTILLQSLWSAIVLLVDRLPISQAQALQITTIASAITPYISFALMVFLIYFGYEYQKRQENGLLRIACRVIVFARVAGYLLGRCVNAWILMLVEKIFDREAHAVQQLFSNITVTVDGLTELSILVGVVLLVAALVRDRVIHRIHYGTIAAFVLYIGLKLFLRTQVSVLAVGIYQALAGTAMLLYLGLLTVLIAHKLGESKEEQ